MTEAVTTPEPVAETSAEVAPTSQDSPEVSAPDSVAETPPPPPDDKLALSKKWESVAQAELKAQRREAKLREERRALEAERAEMRRQVEEARMLRSLLLEDPAKALHMAGVEDPVDWIGKVAKPKSEAEKLREEWEAEKAARTKAEQQAAEQQAWRAFVAEVKPDTHPHLSALYEPEEVVELAQKALAQHLDSYIRQTGRHPTDAEILAHLEGVAKSKFERANKARTPAPAQASEPPPASPQSGTGLQSVNGHTRTLTNNAASQAATAKPPAGFSREEAKRQLMAQLEAETAAARK